MNRYDMMRKFLTKLLLLAVLVAGLQLAITSLVPFNAVPEIQSLDILLAHEVDVIYFGDSTITSVDRSDQNKDFTSAMLQKIRPKLQIGRVSRPAYHMGVYLDYARYVVKRENHPQIVIIPINLRSFSPEWDMRPQYQFEKEKRFLLNNNNLFIRAVDSPLSIFRWYESEVSQQTFENAPVYNGSQLIGVVKDFEEMLSKPPTQSSIESSLLYFYLYELDADHRKIQSMLKLADIYRANNIEVIFYITPLDFQIGENYLGERFAQQVTQNVALITSLLNDKDAILLDLSFSLTSDFFGWYGYPNEHLNENGRYFVAQKLSREIDFLQH